MKDILETLQALQSTPIPNLLIIAGFVFLFLAFVGKVSTYIELPTGRQIWAGFIGALFLVVGIGLFIVPSPNRIPPQQPPIPPANTSVSKSATVAVALDAPTVNPVPPTLTSVPTPIPMTPAPDYATAREVSIDLGTTNDEQGLIQIEQTDARTAPAVIDGKEARLIKQNSTSTHYMIFRVDRSFIFAKETGVRITVEYFDQNAFDFEIQYDSTDVNADEGGVYKGAFLMVSSTNTGQWRVATFDLPDAYFGARQGGNTDFRIAAFGDGDLYINTVTVTKY